VEDYVQHSLIVLVGGLAILLLARFSRKGWVKLHGKTSRKEAIRFWICLLASYALLGLLVKFYPFIFIVFIALLALLGQIGLGKFHLFNERPGLAKDIIYASMISAILAAITGFFLHTP
jgi:hypothetical protein